MFYKVLITENDFQQFGDIIYDLIDDSYNVAVDDKILKVAKTDHEQLGPIFHNTFEIKIQWCFFCYVCGVASLSLIAW